MQANQEAQPSVENEGMKQLHYNSHEAVQQYFRIEKIQVLADVFLTKKPWNFLEEPDTFYWIKLPIFQPKNNSLIMIPSTFHQQISKPFKYHYLHFADGEKEAQKGKVTCSRGELGIEPRSCECQSRPVPSPWGQTALKRAHRVISGNTGSVTGWAWLHWSPQSMWRTTRSVQLRLALPPLKGPAHPLFVWSLRHMWLGPSPGEWPL